PPTRNLPSGRRRNLGDEPRAALKRDVVPQPCERHDEPILDADQEIDVGQTPEQPSDKALEAQIAELHHRRPPPDGGEIADRPITKRRRRGFPGDARRDEPADIAAHLLGGRCDTWSHRPLFVTDCRRIADYEYLRMVR